MGWLGKVGVWMRDVLLPLGGWGLFPAAFLDSSFISLAGGVDLWLISLVTLTPSKAPLYVLLATLGSVAGASALYFAVRKGGEALLEKKFSADALRRVNARVEKSGSWALLIAAVMPPPTPFKLFLIAAGLVRHSFHKFVLALLVGRAIRYSAVAALAALYGRSTWDLLVALGPWFAGGVFLAIILLLLALRLHRRSSALAR